MLAGDNQETLSLRPLILETCWMTMRPRVRRSFRGAANSTDLAERLPGEWGHGGRMPAPPDSSILLLTGAIDGGQRWVTV